MSRIGDLIVRMQLKYQDYQKGLKQAEKDTKGFAGTLGKIKGVGLAVWGAVGASAIAFGKQLIKSSQTIGDSWAKMTSQIKAGWDVFVQSVGAWNWDNFIGRIKEATVAAKALTSALDAEFEVSNSIKLQKATMADELAELEILARDQTKSYKERAAAAQEYLDKVKPLYDQELNLAKSLEDAHLGKFLAGSGLQDTALVREELRRFLVDIGKIPTLMDALAAKSSAQKTIDRGANAFGSNYKKINAAYNTRNQLNNQLKDIQSGYQTDLVALFRAYNDMRGDEDAKPMVDAMIRAGEAAGAFNRETKRMQSALHTAESQMEKEQFGDIAEAAEVIERVSLELPKVTAVIGQAVSQAELPDIIPDGWLKRNKAEVDAAMAELMRLQSITDEINYMIENAAVSALSGATQAFADCVAGIEGADASDVLAALMQPFANTMIQLGEMLIAEGIAIVAFKESLKSLNPYVALAAGTALLAAGAALSSGIKKLGATAGNGATTTSTGASGTAPRNNNIQSEMTIYVKGQLKGSDIVLSGKRTINDWSR